MEKNKYLFVYDLKVGDFLHDLVSRKSSIYFVRSIERITKECVSIMFDVFFQDGSIGFSSVQQVKNKEGEESFFYFDSASFGSVKKIDEKDFICFCKDVVNFERNQIEIEAASRHDFLIRYKKTTQKVINERESKLIEFEEKFNIVMNERKNGKQ